MTIKPDDPQPNCSPARSVVLLLFMPPFRTAHPQRATLTLLAQFLQQHLGSQVRVLRIDEATHPDVVQSFQITHTPTFVLVRQGVEIWRQEDGFFDKDTLVKQIRGVLAENQVER
jgi:thioredoxin-like negative regulator of GroEL